MKIRRYFPISKDIAELKNVTRDKKKKKKKKKKMALVHLNMSMNVRILRQSFDLKFYKLTSFQKCAKFWTSGQFVGDEKLSCNSYYRKLVYVCVCIRV